MKLSINRSFARRTLSLYGLLALTTLGASSASLAQNAPDLQFGPINPAFLNMRRDEATLLHGALPNYGVRPSPLQLAPMKAHEIYFDAPMANTLPAKYDLRLTGKLSPIGNQGQCGCCWAFATMGSLESNLLPNQVCSFSENNLKDTNGFDFGWNNGGNRDMSTAYFARWSGPVNSQDDPFNPGSGVSPANLSPSKHVQEVLYLPDRSGANDNSIIKQAVMTYGAVMTYIYVDFSRFSTSGSHTTYYSPDGSTINHAIDIVGWDDNFDKSGFKTPAPGNGAFICRNSWGTSFGEQGYFYVSYYDKWTGRAGGNTVFNNAEPINNYTQVYQYDPLGCIGSIGWTGKTQAWFANVFTATSADNVAAVSFYTLAPNTNYTVNVYSNATNGPITAGSSSTAATGTFSTPGYHTVILTNPITLTAKQKFSVVVSVSANTNWLIPVQYPIQGYSSKATAGAGQSFVSLDGKTWSDLPSMQPNTSVCVKAFMKSGPPSVATPTFSPNGGAYNVTQNVTINCATQGATIHYTTNGNDPTENDPTVNGPVAVSQSLTLKAKAWMTGDSPSAVKSAAYTIAPYATGISVAAASGMYGQSVNLQATLQGASPSGPLSGKTLTFQLNGASVGTGVTNANGIATCTIKVADSLALGANAIAVAYAGETGYKASSGSSTLTVAKASTKLSAANVTGKPGAKVSLSATLSRTTDGSALSNRTLSFTVNGASAITATTDANGTATVSYTIPASSKAGNVSYGVGFAGDTKNAAGSATGTITVNTK